MLVKEKLTYEKCLLLIEGLHKRALSQEGSLHRANISTCHGGDEVVRCENS